MILHGSMLRTHRFARGTFLTQPDVRHLMLSALPGQRSQFANPLMRQLEAIRRSWSDGAGDHPRALAREDVGPVNWDLHVTLRSGAFAPLSQLVHEKTASNPFFAIQLFLLRLPKRVYSPSIMALRDGLGIDSHLAQGFHHDNCSGPDGLEVEPSSVQTQKALTQLPVSAIAQSSALLTMVYQDSKRKCTANFGKRSERASSSTGRFLRFLHEPCPGSSLFFDRGKSCGAEAHCDRAAALTHTPPERRERRSSGLSISSTPGRPLITSPDEREQLAGA